MPAIPSNSSRTRACTVPVAIYSRVSTANQVGGRFDSCESQAAVCRDFIAQHASDGWFEIACFSDPAYSGGSMNRPGVRALMRQIEDQAKIEFLRMLKLETGNVLHAAHRLYARHGFISCGPFGDYTEAASSIFMEKAL